VENIHPHPQAAALTDALGAAQRLHPEMLIGSNFGLVATIGGETVVKAPNWFYGPRANPSLQPVRRSYTQYLEGDPVVVVMEFLSAEDNGELSLRSTPPYGKLYFYEQILQVPTYVIYHPAIAHLEVRRLENQRYVAQAPNEQGRFWIPELELFLGIWPGERLAQTLNWLRWWDADGNLLLWSSEQAEQAQQQAEQERQRAERLAELLRSEGIDPNQDI
jgi:Uma2 family endonuclease